MSIKELVIDDFLNRDMTDEQKNAEYQMSAELMAELEECSFASEKDRMTATDAAENYGAARHVNGLRQGFELAARVWMELLGIAAKGGAKA